jgi:hypothetical protein
MLQMTKRILTRQEGAAARQEEVIAELKAALAEIKADIGSSEDRCEDRRLAVRRRRGTKKRTQDSVRSRQTLSASRKRVIRRVVPEVRKGNIRKGPSKSSRARGAPKGRRLQKTQRVGQECKTGIWGCNFKKQLRMRVKRSCGRIIRKTRRMSSGTLRRVALVRTDVSEEPSASFIRVTRIGELGTTLAVTSNRRTLRRYTK